MSQNPEPPNQSRILISAEDINRATEEGVLSPADADKLIHWAYDQRFNRSQLAEPTAAPAPELRKGFNVVTVLYYFGAMLMISACAWFLGDKWDVLKAPGICVTVIIYMVIALSLGQWLRRKGYIVGGGLLITVAVSLVPLLIYSIERMTGFWPAQDPGEYAAFYPMIHGSWIVMELATIAAAALALRFVSFGFLTAPMAFCFWFFSMDVAALIFKQNSLDSNQTEWVSVLVGLLTIAVGFGLDRTITKRGAPRTEDFAFWCYLFGLAAFWGGLTSMNSDSEIRRFVYLLINVGLVGVAVKLRRSTFLVFGAFGVYLYLGHLAWQVFKDSLLFPFVLALLGLTLILGTVWGQKYWRKRLREADGPG